MIRHGRQCRKALKKKDIIPFKQPSLVITFKRIALHQQSYTKQIRFLQERSLKRIGCLQDGYLSRDRISFKITGFSNKRSFTLMVFR